MTVPLELTTGWTLDLAEGSHDVPEHVRAALPISASIPGTVHTDLLAAGLIPDPYLDTNELALDWIGRAEWVYERDIPSMAATDVSAPVLAFDGLDTIATVQVDGVDIGSTANQHRRYEFPLGALLSGDGPHRLTVRFHSAWEYAQRREQRLGALPNAYPAPFNHIRKSACNFGWDWGPTLVTAGIWRTARLHSAGPRLASVDVEATLEGTLGAVTIAASFGTPVGEGWSVRATVGEHTVLHALGEGEVDARVRVDVSDPELWWPRGLGAQPLSDVVVELRDQDDSVVSEHATRVGFRSLVLDTAPDASGTPFVFEINGARVPIRGVNWIPDDCFPSRITEARLRERLTQAVDANVNLLRVWGGGVYESEMFYRLCDELGLLVWQDFLFACAAYPEDDELAAEIEAEARDNVQRLRPHPSLVLWNGNNENIWGWFDWDWQPRLEDRAWGRAYYLEVLPAIVAEVDPSRPYWPGSPYSGTMSIHPNDPAHGLMHIWDVWNEADYAVYRDYEPRFASEFGWQAPPTWSTITESIREHPLSPTSPGMLHHQKANDGNGKLERGLAPHFDVPAAFEDWHFAMQLNQARAITVGVEHLRSLRPLNYGAIIWQLNDCWPVTSWAAIDGYGRKKPLWYSMRAAYATRLLTIQPRDEGLVLHAVNDGGDSWREPFTARRVRFDGTEVATYTSRFALDRFESVGLVLPDEISRTQSPASELIEVVTNGGIRALWFFAEDRDLDYDPARLDVSVERDAVGTVHVGVTARTLVRDLTLFPDRLTPSAEADDALVTLLPGQRHVYRVTGVPEGREGELTLSPVLRSANDLVVR